MSFFNRLTAVICFFTLSGLVFPAHAQTKKGDKFLAEGRLHEAKKEWDAALESYRKAQAEDPTDPVYQVAVDKGRLQAAQAHVEKGMTIRSQGRLADSLVEFQKAYAINPGSIVAAQELEETQQMLERERQRVQETGKEAAPEQRALTPGQAAQKEEDDRIGRMLAVPELVPTRPGTIDLKMTGKTKTLFETLAKYSGINVLWDPDFTAPANDSFTIDFKAATLDQAFDQIAAMSKSSWKRLSPTVVFVTNAK
jgi:general secretion pathway protein D